MPYARLKQVMNMKLRIRDLREDADYTQSRVAAYLHCDQSQYSKYERGERPLPLDCAVKLAERSLCRFPQKGGKGFQ